MIKPQEWDSTPAATGEYKSIIPGGYVCRILSVREELTRSRRPQIVIAFDVIEGEYAGFFTAEYDRKVISDKDAKWPNAGVYRQLTDGTSLTFFKGMITAIEQSNPGYAWEWNEQTLKGKLFGAVYGEEEFVSKKDDSIKVSCKVQYIRSVDAIRKGVKFPEIKKIRRDDTAKDAFNGSDVDIPFK